MLFRSDAIKVTDIDVFLKNHQGNLFVIGGKTIYRLSLPYADRLYITFIDASHEGNVYFPPFDLSAYKLIQEDQVDVLRFCVYEKVKA